MECNALPEILLGYLPDGRFPFYPLKPMLLVLPIELVAFLPVFLYPRA
nr:MAG: hypothetical protein [Bacteriophage sp.]